MLNRTDIINMALQRCGAAGVNSAFQDSQENAIAMAAYSRSYRYVLSQYAWGFAQKYTLLAQESSAPAMGYAYAYTLPGDCLQAIDAYGYGVDEDGNAITDRLFTHEKAKYEIVGKSLYSNSPALALRYVSSDDIDMPDVFGSVLAWYLAFEIAPYIQQGTNTAQMFIQLYQQELDEAKAWNDMQTMPEQPEPWKESHFLRMRFREAE